MKLSSEILRDAHVMVVGCGALGNEVLKNLALCGVGHIACVDFDIVEPDNLSRSVLFSREDAAAGKPKVDAVKESIRRLTPETEVLAVKADIAADVGLGLIRDADVVLGCVDNRWARFMLNRHCMRMGKKWIDGGIALEEGTSRVFEPGRNCYACSLSSEETAALRRRISCSNVIRKAVSDGKAPTSSVTASIVGATMAREALRIIEGTGSSCGRMFYYDGEVPSCGIAAFTAYDAQCPEHEEWGPVERIDLDCTCSVSELLGRMPSGSELLLRDDCFVDYVENRLNGEHMRVMLPGRKVQAFIASASRHRHGVEDDCYQNEFRTIGGDFPYGSLTLEQLGIPDRDVIHVDVNGKDKYLELKGRC